MKTAVLVLAVTIAPAVAMAQQAGGAVLTTKHFAFFSDLPTNVHDALIAASSARRAKQPDPLADGATKECFDRLPATAREGWTRGVDYYLAGKSTNFQRVLIRLELAALLRRDGVRDAANRQYLEEAAAIREAATPAYRQCRWQSQDATNRRWIESVAPLLTKYEATLGEQLSMLFKMEWAGLPFRVDVVEAALPTGGNSASPDFPTLHILISSTNSGNQGLAGLEVVFHEATHFLATPEAPLGKALATAFNSPEATSPRGYLHQVHFFITGEAVRRTLARAGESYTPYLYQQRLFSDGFRDAAARIWPIYMDGKRTLDEAAGDLAQAMNAAPAR